MSEITPSENEWAIMEILWSSKISLTASEVITQLKDSVKVTDKTIRVMINRLLKKGVLDFTIDKNDSRVYHYFPARSREECITEKSNRFINSYFQGNVLLAVISLLNQREMHTEHIEQLTEVLVAMKNSK